MENEKRLIDAHELMSDVYRCDEQQKNDIWHTSDIEFLLEAQPTVDAVEVVRCKDCKQWSRNSGIAESPNGHCFCHDMETNGHDFCSYGERRDDV